MSWFDTPDSWWDKEHETEISSWSGRRTEELWDFNRDNVPEEHHWPSKLRASFTIRGQGEEWNNVYLYFNIKAAVWFDHRWSSYDTDQVIIKPYLSSGRLYELIHTDIELPIQYSTATGLEDRLSVRAVAVAEGYNGDSYTTEAEIHNIQFFGELPSSHSVFWHKFVNTYET